MKSQTKIAGVALLAFTLGIGLAALLVWNPANWQWAEKLLSIHHHVAEVEGEAGGRLWTCGMHPQVIQEEPGNCPICGMRLMPVKDASGTAGMPAGQAGAGQGKKERKVLYWRAPMDPNYTSDKPGKSPMGMDLIPVYEDEQATGSGVRVDPNFLQNFAVRTTVVEKGSIPIEIRTVGILAHDETNVVSVNTKFEGWIEKAYFNNIGEHVQRGDVLFDIYSPQLVTTQKEFLAARDFLQSLQESGYPDAIARAQSLLDSARERLRFWDITGEQIDELQQTGKVMRTLRIVSPASGHIVAKMNDSLEGMKLTPGMTVFKLADHTQLWAEAEFYENQLKHLREGQPVTIEADAFPGRTWRGKIAFFRPALNPETRTLQAFVEVDNRDLMLRPQMFVNVLCRAPSHPGAVKVPQQAVLHSGERSVVIVEKAKGLFEPREVELGVTGGDYQEVRSGLRPGEVVVTSSQFLIDSESNLKAAISQLLGERPRTESLEKREPKAPVN